MTALRGKTAYMEAFKSKHQEGMRGKATILLGLQLILILLLCSTIILVCLVSTGQRLILYLSLLIGLTALLVYSTAINWRGNYNAAAWIASCCTIVGPWLSILFDPFVFGGDVIPFVYVGVSIQLCAILLPSKATLYISAAQLAGVFVVFLLSPYLTLMNWPSLFAFFVFTAAIGISSGYMNRRQLEQIERQHRQLLEREALLRDLSIKDPLTGLYNRRYMEESFDREIESARRKGRSLAVILADVDNFKAINDTYGHVAGDLVLGYVADFFIENIRGSDIACRYGGDEFVLILPECPCREAAEKAEFMRRSISETEIRLQGQTLRGLTLSFGVAAFPENGSVREELVASADAALYSAKQAGKNRVV